MSLTLPVDVYSPDQLNELILELQDAMTALRDNAARSKNSKSDDADFTASPLMEQLMRENKILFTDISRVEDLAKNLQTTLQTAPTAHLLLAGAPTRAVKRQLVGWFRTEIDPQTLITFAARSDLGGGAIVQVGSHVYDLSFRRSIINNKARLTEIAGV